MGFLESWIESDPDGAVITGSLLDDFQRQTKRALRERLEGDPADPNTGIFETFAGAVVKLGSARTYVVTAANLGTLTLQDGRVAITSDTNRLYHLKATGLVEVAYQVRNTDGTLDTLGYHLSGNGTYASAKVYKDAVNGLILSGTTGSSYDAVMTNNAGNPVVRILTGTLNVTMPGNLTTVSHDVTSSMTSPIFLSPGASATSGWLRCRNGDKFGFRNAANTGDVIAVGLTGTALVLQGEATVTLNQDTFVNGMIQASNFKSTGVIATVGTIRLANNQTIGWRNSLNSADIQGIGLIGSIMTIAGEATINLNIGGTTYLNLNSGVVNASAIAIADDQSKKLVLGRFSGGSQDSYIQLSAASTGFRITNAAGATDILIITNAGAATIANGLTVAAGDITTSAGKITSFGDVVAGGVFQANGTATAGVGAQLRMGGNSSTVASTYGGGGVSALPAQPLGYLTWYLGAVNIKIPYYNA